MLMQGNNTWNFSTYMYVSPKWPGLWICTELEVNSLDPGHIRDIHVMSCMHTARWYIHRQVTSEYAHACIHACMGSTHLRLVLSCLQLVQMGLQWREPPKYCVHVCMYVCTYIHAYVAKTHQSIHCVWTFQVYIHACMQKYFATTHKSIHGVRCPHWYHKSRSCQLTVAKINGFWGHLVRGWLNLWEALKNIQKWHACIQSVISPLAECVSPLLLEIICFGTNLHVKLIQRCICVHVCECWIEEAKHAVADVDWAPLSRC